MTQVTNVTVQFERKRQPAQYETSGAVISFSATVGDQEDHVAVATKLLGDAKTIVLQELGLVAVGTSASASVIAGNNAAKADTGEAAATGGKKSTKKTKDAPAAAEQRQISTGEERVGPNANDIPGEGEPAPKSTAKPSTGSADIPDDPAPAKPNGKAKDAPALSAADIQARVAGLVKEKKLDVPTVKGISREFGHERIADIPVDKLPEYVKKIDDAVAKFQGTADI